MCSELADPRAISQNEDEPPAFAPEQEVRLAVVLYGGVSLAIYMYGVAQELFNLVWSTAPSEAYGDGDPPAGLARDRCESTDAVYRELGRLLPLHSEGDGSGDRPVRTRFVVDIIAGTSAGGINGICLAKALAEEAELEPLKDIWVTEGDIGLLLNDEQNRDYFKDDERPESLLSGQRMLHKLIAAIEGMTPSRRGDSRLVDELDLWVTATDLEGLEIPIKIANATVMERRHANRYHFRHSPSDRRYDFDGTADDFIAYAARSTSAFPFAFAPVLLDRNLRDLERVPDEAWKRFYTAYATTPAPLFPERAFSDGGILDNKPFSYATETLVNRHASLPVDRKVVYVEPDPADNRKRREEPWSAIATTQASLLALPQLENIREDVQTVLNRNRTIERVRDIITYAGTTDPERATLGELTPERIDDWRTEVSQQAGPAYGVYHRLKVRGVVDYLASLVVRAAGFDPGSDEDFAVHYLVRAWKEAHYPPDPDPRVAQAAQHAFLEDFDIPYRLRRLNFLLERVKELRSRDMAVVTRVLEACGVDPAPIVQTDDREAALLELRRELSAMRRTLHQTETELVKPGGPLADKLKGLGIKREQLTSVLEGRTDAGMRARAQELVEARRFDDVAKVIRSVLKESATQLRASVDDVLSPRAEDTEPRTSLRAALHVAYKTFETYDLPLYLVEYGTPVGETNPVDIVRVSPREADGPEATERSLKGLRLFHFGAFLDEQWRRNDIVWGRLDGSECLIKALLPESPAKADELVRDAHRAILEEYRAEVSQPADGDVFEWFRHYRVADDPSEEPTAKALNRGAVVMTHLIEAELAQGGVGRRMREITDGLRRSLSEREDAPAVDAVLGVARTHPWYRLALVVWWFLLVLGVVLVVLGDGWRLAGCALLGLCAGLGLVAVGARLAVRGAVREALSRARGMAYARLFPRRGARDDG